MKANLLSLSILASSIATAQPTFNQILDVWSTYQANLVELSSHNVIAPFARGPGVSIISPSGAVFHVNPFWSSSLLSMGALRKYGENELYFSTGYEQSTCSIPGQGGGSVNPALGKMDSLGNVLSLHHYTLNAACFNYAGDLEITSNKSMLLWGSQDLFFVLRTDSTLAPLWARRFSEEGSFRFIKELPGGDLLAGFDLPTAGASVARLDANGNFIWCKSYMRPLGRMHDAIVESDSSFMITGFTSTAASAKLFMMELDGDGEVQWCRGYGSGAYQWYTPQWSQLERTLDGNYAVLATLGQSGFFFRPFLMKTDLNGDTLWSRSMGADGFVYHTRDLLAASDGGFVFSGVIWGDLPDMNTGLLYVFKADSLGHFSCSSRNHPVQLFDLFPIDSSFTLTSTDGATMHTAFVSDTTFAPYAVYDACEVANAFRPYPDYKRERMRVRPNPTPGRVTISFTDPLMAESYYSVYDGMGKLLYQRPLPKGRQTVEVDLSRFGAGTYVIRFTDKEGSCYERVVVE